MTIGILASFLLALPGYLFVLRRNETHSEYAFRVAGAAVAYWIVSYWFLSIIPLSTTRYMLLSLAVSCYLLWVRYRTKRKKEKRTGSVWTYIPLAVFLIAIGIPQYFVLTMQLIPAGNDMSMHAYIARAIATSSGFPQNLLPMVPVTSFGNYPFGFSTLTALIAKLGTLSILQSALVMTVFSHVLFDISVFLLLRRKYSVWISIYISVLVSWLSAAPHLFITWGANPTVLSFALLLMGLAELPDKTHPGTIRLSSLLFAASFLTNYMLPIALLYVALPLCLLHYRTVYRWITQHIRREDMLFIGLMLAPLLLHLLRYPYHMSEQTASFVRSLHQSELLVWSGKFDMSFPRILWRILCDTFHPGLLILYVASIVILFFTDRKRALDHGVAVVSLTLLIVNAKFWVLPFSSVLYPFRFSMLLLIPMSYAFAECFETIRKLCSGFLPGYRVLLFLTVFVPLSVWFIRDTRIPHYIQSSSEASVASQADLDAFRWLQHNTTTRDVILNSYFDAGLWIPAAIGRPITVYHTNPVDYEAIRTRVLPRAAYAYVGSKHTDTIGQLLTNVGYSGVSYEPVYEKDGVFIYRLVFPEVSR